MYYLKDLCKESAEVPVQIFEEGVSVFPFDGKLKLVRVKEGLSFVSMYEYNNNRKEDFFTVSSFTTMDLSTTADRSTQFIYKEPKVVHKKDDVEVVAISLPDDSEETPSKVFDFIFMKGDKHFIIEVPSASLKTLCKINY